MDMTIRAEAALLVLTARASRHLEVPLIETLVGPQGALDILLNIDSVGGDRALLCCLMKS